MLVRATTNAGGGFNMTLQQAGQKTTGLSKKRGDATSAILF
jgi:hypothetical protein